MSFENPTPPSRSYSPLIMTALLFFCIGFATAYAIFAISGDRILPTGEQVAGQDEDTNDKALQRAPETPDNPPVDAAESEDLPPEEAPPSPGDLRGFWPGHHLIVGIPGTTLDEETKAMLAEFRPGGILLRAENLVDAAQTRNLTLAIREAYGLGTAIEARPFIMVNQEGGAHNPLNIDDAPSFAALGVANEVEHVQATARRYGLTARARGINVILGPTMDRYLGDASEDWLKNDAFGDSPVAITENAIAFAQGIADAGVIAVGKHFPGLGPAQLSPARVYEIPITSEEDLAMNMLPFAETARLGIPGMIVGHASVPGLDKQAPARPASLSPVLVETVLRANRGYNEVVLADDISSHPATRDMAAETVVIQALLAGCDAVIISAATPADVRRICEAVLLAIDEDDLPGERLVESRGRMERWQIQISEWQPPEEGEMEPDVDTPAIVPVPEAPTMPETKAKPAPKPAAAAPEPAPQPEGTELKTHPVVAGDTLAAVAGRYGVSIAEVQAWNALKSEEIQVGQKLKIYLAPEAPATAPTPEPAAPAPPAPTAMDTPTGEFMDYVVKPGDMLRRVAEAHGSTEAELVKINGLARPDIIQVGQTLKIPVREAAPAE